jgi:hypothetical protein
MQTTAACLRQGRSRWVTRLATSFVAAGIVLAAACGRSSAVSNAVPISMQETPSAASATDNGPQSYLYVSSALYPGELDIFLRGDLSKGPVDRITEGISYPDGMFVDRSGTLYVAVGGGNGHDTIKAYAKGGHEPIRFYRGIFCASDVAVDRQGVVYAPDYCKSRVIEFAPGSTRRLRMLHPGGAPVSVTIDSRDNLYVAYKLPNGYWGQVKRYKPGATEGVELLPPQAVSFIGGIALDRNGSLLVVNENAGVVDVFTKVNKPPTRILHTGQTFPYRVAFGQHGERLYVTFPYLPSSRAHPGASGPSNPNTVVELAYPSGKLLRILQQPSWLPYGVAVWPPADF